jgi:enoyl-CoA hydratase
MDTLKLDWLSDSRIAVVTLNRPDALNAMNTLMIQELLNLFREQTHNEALRCGVITGRGTRAFSTGGDLKERNGMSNDQWRRQHQLIEEMFKAMWDFPIPIIAAVEGFAFAGGCEIALGADFIVASATAQFALKEVTRGILPGGGRSAEPGAQYRDASGSRNDLFRARNKRRDRVRVGSRQSRGSRRRCAQERTRISRTDR